MNEEQPEFLFADGPTPEFVLPDPRSNFFAEVAAFWQLPVGERIHVNLTGHNLFELQGLLELAQAPDLPLDRREVLRLKIGPVEFSNRQITSWSAL